jgi:hypothetical protein
VTVAIAVSAPLERKGGGAHGGVVVLITTVDTVFKDFKGAPKAQSGYWHSPTFRCESGDRMMDRQFWHTWASLNHLLVPFVIELTLDFEALSIEVEYFQEDFDREFGNRYITSRGQIMITGTVMSFSGKIRYKHMSSYGTYRCRRNASATIVS